MTRQLVLASFEVAPEDAATVAQLAAAMTAATRQEPGCLHYAFARDLEQPGCFRLSELWRDAPALDAHFATPHMAAFRRGLRDVRIVQRSAIRYSVLDDQDLLAAPAQ